MRRVIITAALVLCATTAGAQDVVQPPTVTIAANTGKTTATASWSAPGDACTNNTVAAYDVRYASDTITECNFTSATQLASIPSPSAPGNTDCVDTGAPGSRTCNTTYYFAWKCKDAAGNWSDIVTTSATTRSCGATQEVLCP